MSQWEKVRIGDFLKRKRVPVILDERTKYKLVTVRLYHKGIVLREEKLGSLIKSNMYKVSKGDFILSGIDARNGAFGIIPDELDGAIVTNDFWYFDIDESIIKREYFLWLTTTPVFLDACEKASKGETQRIRLQKEAFFDYEINCPTIDYQDEFLSKIIPVINKIEEVKKQTEQQLEYTKQLRQNILQDAIEGKLTADFCQKNQNNTKTITSNQKNHDKKLSSLLPITKDEIPFNIPNSWGWVRLGMIIEYAPRNGYSPKGVDFETPVKTLKLGAVTSGIFNSSECKYINEEIPEDAYCWLKKGDILIERSNSLEYVGMSAIYTGNDNEFIYPDLLMRFRVSNGALTEYVHKALIAPFNRSYFMSKAKGAQKSMPKINQECVINTLIPLPPLAEQKEIVARVENKFQKVSELEAQITEREQFTKQLMQSILKEAFEER